MNLKVQSFPSRQIVLFYIIGGFIADALTKYTMVYDFSFHNYALVFRTPFIAFFVLHLVQNHFKSFVLPAILLSFIFFAQLLFRDFNIHFLEIAYFFKYLSIFFIFGYISSNFDSKLSRTIEIIFVANTIIIAIGILANLEFVRTYSHFVRFGFNGVIASPNETAIMYHIMLIYFYYKYLNAKTKTTLTWLLLCIIMSFISGTKACILISFFLFVHYLIYSSNKRLKIQLLLGMSLITIMLTALLFKFNFFDYFIDFYYDKGFLNTITSMRYQMLIERLPLNLETWEAVNYLFGFSHCRSGYMIEMDPFDLFLFFGFIGAILYYLSVGYILKPYTHSTFSKFFVLTIICLSILSGHYTYSALNYGIFSVVFLYIHRKPTTSS